MEEKDKDKMKWKFNDLHGKIGSLKNECFTFKIIQLEQIEQIGIKPQMII